MTSTEATPDRAAALHASQAEGAVPREYDAGGHGWWPYVVPYVAFLLMSEIGLRLPEGAAPWVLGFKPMIVLALILWFRGQGAYPEWRGQAGHIGLFTGLMDVAVGLALTVVWVLPYFLMPGMRPEPGGAFDPTMAGPALVPLILVLRFFGYALVTPIFEELFIRSFVMRISEVWETERDFRDLPIGFYTAKSLGVTTIIFTLGHVPWEWWVCVPWVVLSSLWFYYRKNLSSVMLVHAVTNGALLALAIWGGDLLHDADGSPFSFWFFV